MTQILVLGARILDFRALNFDFCTAREEASCVVLGVCVMSVIMMNVLTSGAFVFVGFLLFFLKLRPRRMLWLLGHSLWLDLGVSAIAFVMHYGTFTGVMAAAVAGLLTSFATMLAVWLFGVVKNNHYYPGVFDIRDKL